MVTLLERLSADPTGKGSALGPVRNRGKRSFSTPYVRAFSSSVSFSHGTQDYTTLFFVTELPYKICI